MKKRTKIIILCISIFIVLLDFSPILYYKIYPHPGSWPCFYNYDKRSPSKLLAAIERMTDDNLSISCIKDTLKHSRNYIQVVFLDKSKQDYYHTWVLIDSVDTKNFTQIVLCYISKSIDCNTGKLINKDFDFLTNVYKREKFESLVIKKLDADNTLGPTSSIYK